MLPKKSPRGEESLLTSEAEQSIFNTRKKTHCFGAGREHFEKVYNPINLSPDVCVPGPGTYSDKTRDVGVNARKWSLKGRNFYLDNTKLALKKNIPDPCKYGDLQKMDALGVYFNSELLNSKAARMSQGDRFFDLKTRAPGPGTYEQLGEIRNLRQTVYHSPKIKNLHTTEIKLREIPDTTKVPGPGTYR